MDKKDIVIGVFIIATVVLAGTLGFVIITSQPTQPPDQLPTDRFGLPDDWSTAPNATSFMLYNQTGASIEVTLKDLLDGVALSIEQEAAGGPEINEYKKLIYTYTFLEPSSGLYVTGVDILDILEKYDTNFGWDLKFTSNYGHELEMTTGDIISRMYHGSEYPIIIALAANKEWLGESLLAPMWGNFSIVGEFMPSSIFDLQKIEVLSNWTVDIVINGTVEYTIDESNMNLNGYDDTYHYDRDDWWSFNRHYWGRNISEILSPYVTGLNYTMRAWSVDGWATPRPFGGKKEDRYNNTHIEEGISPPFPKSSGGTNDLINVSQVPLPTTNLLMSLVHADQEFGETGQGITDPVWPYRRMCGYGRGPFYLLIPGRPRDNYLSHVTTIEITTYAGSIPPGFDL